MRTRNGEQNGLHVTINTTEDCNLRCKYCYEINKKHKSIDFEYCKKFIDDLLTDDDPCGSNLMADSDEQKRFISATYESGIIMDFIGGDSLIDPDLIDKIMDYFVMRANTLDTKNARKWRKRYRFAISTNGTLFSKRAKEVCEKWANNLSIGISIDGCPEIHDMNRIYSNGKGSMSKIMEEWEWFKRIFPGDAQRTKATAAKSTVPYLFESLKFMYEELGITNIDQNFIMEDTGMVGEDYHLLEDQLKLCLKYVLEHNQALYWSMLDYNSFAKHTGVDDPNTSRCGSGMMPCLGIDGTYVTCFRWLPHTQTDGKSPYSIGNVKEGFSHKENAVEVRNGSCRGTCSDEKCLKCPYESACSYCIAGCYSENQSFKRTTHICDITKIQCKYAKIYWNEYNKLIGEPMEFGEEFQIGREKWNSYHVLGTDDC